MNTNSNPIIVKNDNDMKLVLKPVVEKIFQAIRNHTNQGDDGYTVLGKMIIIIDHFADYNDDNAALCEIIAELMNELDPYDMKGLIFDEELFDINRPTWTDEHTSRFIDTEGDIDGMGPYHDNVSVSSYRLTIDIDAVDGYFTRIAFMRTLIDELFSNSRITELTIRNPIGVEIDSTDQEDILLYDIHAAVRMFNRTVKFLSYNNDSVNIVFNPVI